MSLGQADADVGHTAHSGGAGLVRLNSYATSNTKGLKRKCGLGVAFVILSFFSKNLCS